MQGVLISSLGRNAVVSVFEWGCLCCSLLSDANHCFDQAILRELADGRADHARAVAQHRHAVTDVIDFFEVMGDVEDTHPARFEASNPLKQALDGRLLQRCGGFVENQKARAARKCAGNLDNLALLHGQVSRKAIHI